MTGHVERQPLRVGPGVSPRLAVFVSVVHGLALLVVCAVPLGIGPRLAMGAAVILGLAHGLAGPVLHRLPWSLREAVWKPDGSWLLTLSGGRQLDARLLPSTYVGSSLVVLAFRCGRLRPCFLPLLSDNLDPNLLRRLRVRLRLGAHDVSPRPESGP
jgi:toxin CptA